MKNFSTNQEMSNYKHRVRNNAYIFMLIRTSGENPGFRNDNRIWRGKDGNFYIELTADELVSFYDYVREEILMRPIDRRRHPHCAGILEIYDDYRE